MTEISFSEDRGFLVKAATLSIITIEYAITFLTPVLGAVAAAFPDVSSDMVKMLQSAPQLTMMIVALFVGPLTKVVRKKTLLIIAMFLMFFSSLAPAFGGGFTFILVTRFLFGAGRGVVFPFAMSMIIELFEGKDRDLLMGWRSTTGSVAGIIYQMLGGFLATIFWRYAFWTTLLMVLPMVLIMWKLPEPPQKPIEKDASGKAPKQLSTTSWVIIIGNVFLMFFAYTFMTNMAIVINSMGIGTPAAAGSVMSTFVATSACCGLIFGFVIRPVFKRQTVTLGMLFLGIALTFLTWAPTLSMFFVGAIFFGVGFSVYNTALYLDLGEVSHQSAASLALSLHMAGSALGQFLSPIVLALLRDTIGLTGEKAGWQISGPVLLVGTVAVFLVKLLYKPKKSMKTAETSD